MRSTLKVVNALIHSRECLRLTLGLLEGDGLIHIREWLSFLCMHMTMMNVKDSEAGRDWIEDLFDRLQALTS